MPNNNPNEFLLGAHGSSDFKSTCEEGSPLIFKAGLAVRRSPNGSLSLTDGGLIGVSVGRDLSNTSKTSVCRSGNDIPVLLANVGVQAYATIGVSTFIARLAGEAGNNLEIVIEDGATGNQAAVDIDENVITITIDAEATTANTVKAAIEGAEEINALILVEIEDGEGLTIQVEGAESFAGGEEPYNYVTIGQPVKFDESGMASDDGTTTKATYRSGVMVGIDPVTKEKYSIALVDFGGGL